MKYIIIIVILLVVHFKAYSSENECVFQGTVHPVEKTETIKELYNIACRFFINNFDAKLNPEIKLNNVYYIESWKILDFLPDDFEGYGLFYTANELTRNDIYIKTNETGLFKDKKDKIANQSVVFHELIHFFIKSASFEHFLKNDIVRNGVIEEVLCYWSQNKYVQMVTEGKNNLMDYIIPDNEKFVLSDDLPTGFYVRYVFSKKSLIYNSIHFINNDIKEKYNKFINGEYPLPKW